MASLIYSVCAWDSPPGVSINHLDPDLEKLLFLGLFYKKKNQRVNGHSSPHIAEWLKHVLAVVVGKHTPDDHAGTE